MFIRERSGGRRFISDSFGCPGGCWVTFGSLGSFGLPLSVVEFIQARLARLWAHSGWPGCRRVHLGSLSPFGRVLGDVVFIWVRTGDRSGTPWVVHFGLLCSFGRGLCVVGIIGVISLHLGAAWGSFERALRVVGFIQFRRILSGAVCLRSFGRALGEVGIIRVRWVYSGARVLAVVGFIRMRHCGRWVHWGSLGSFRRALGAVVVIRFPWVHSCVALGWSC